MDRQGSLSTLTLKLDALYQKKAVDLLSGSVPDDKYRSHLAYIQAIRDVLKLVEDTAKEARELR